MEVTEMISWMVFAVLIFALVYLIHKKFVENNVWNILKSKYKDSRMEKIFQEEMFVSKFGTIENNSLFYKLDRLILTSGLQKKISWLNGERYFLILVLSFLTGTTAGIVITHNMFLAFFSGAACLVAFYVLVLAMAGKTYNQIEDGTSIFVSILSNHAKGSSDLVTIMQSTYPSLEGPIKELVGKFLMDAEQTGNVDLALDFMQQSVENRQLKTIIINLKNCMHYQANYEEVLAQMMGQIAATLSAREERKNILFSMKLTLIVISIASVLIVWLIGKGIGIDVKAILTSNLFGQSLLFMTGVLYLFVVVKLFGTDKQ